MHGQVFHTHSEDDNLNAAFAHEVARRGLSLWPWIISHPESQSESGGPIACAFTSLQFAKLALRDTDFALRAGDADDVAGRLLVELTRSLFFGAVLNICRCAPVQEATRMYDTQEAFELLHDEFSPVLTPLLAGSPSNFSPTIIAESLFALEETRLCCALNITYAEHIFSCVYIPFRVPLFLVFDSARRFERGASIVVHTTRAAATAHITAMCLPGAGSRIVFDFFVSNETAMRKRHDAVTAAVMLDLRFAEGREMREAAASRRAEGSTGQDTASVAAQIARDRAYAEQFERDSAPLFPPLIPHPTPPRWNQNESNSDPFLRPMDSQLRHDPPPTYQSPFARPNAQSPLPPQDPLPPSRRDSSPRRDSRSRLNPDPYTRSRADGDPFLQPMDPQPGPQDPPPGYQSPSLPPMPRSILRSRPNHSPRPAVRPQRTPMPPPRTPIPVRYFQPQAFRAYPTPPEDSPPPLTPGPASGDNVLREASRQRERVGVRNDRAAAERYAYARSREERTRLLSNTFIRVQGTVW